MKISNTLSNLIIRGSSIGLQLALVPLAIPMIGKDEYGIWMISISLATILIALDLGLLNTSFNISARNLNNKIADLCAFAAARDAAIVMVLIFTALFFIIKYTNLESLLNSSVPDKEIKLLIMGVCGISLLTVPFSIFNQRLLARMQAARMAPYIFFGNLSAFFLAWLVTQLSGPKLLFYSAAMLIPLFFQVWVALNPRISNASIPVRSITAQLKRARIRIKKQRSAFFYIQIAALGSYNLDTLIVGIMLSSAEVAEFALVSRYFSIIAILLSVYLMTEWPIYARIARDKPERLGYYFKSNMIYSVIFSLTCVVILFLIKDPFFNIWTRNEIKPEVQLMVAFALLSIVNSAIGNFSVVQNATGRLKIQAKISGLMLIPNILISLLLVQIIGASGPIIASIVCGLLTLIAYSREWEKQRIYNE